jgi:hypothetical protein
VYNLYGKAAKSKIAHVGIIQDDSKLLSGFPFIGHGNPDNNLNHSVYYFTSEGNSLFYSDDKHNEMHNLYHT